LSSRSFCIVCDILHGRWREERTLYGLELLLALQGISASETLSLRTFCVQIHAHCLAHQPTGILAIGGEVGINPVRDFYIGSMSLTQWGTALLQAWHEALDKIEPLIERHQARDTQRVIR